MGLFFLMYFLVNDNKKFFIGWSAKAACTSVKMWFCNVAGIKATESNVHKVLGYGQNKWSNLHARDPKTFKNYRKYIVIRNPYRRLVSGYIGVYIKNPNRSNRPWKTFQSFVEALEADPGFKNIDRHHFVPQTGEYFPKINKIINVWDRIIPAMDLSTHFKEINRELNVNFEISKHNKSFEHREARVLKPAYSMTDEEIKRHKPAFNCFYNEDIASVVHKIYKKDFEFFESCGIQYSIGR